MSKKRKILHSTLYNTLYNIDKDTYNKVFANYSLRHLLIWFSAVKKINWLIDCLIGRLNYITPENNKIYKIVSHLWLVLFIPLVQNL